MTADKAHSNLTQRLAELRARVNRSLGLAGILMFLTIASGVTLALILAEAAFHFPPGGRMALDWVWVASVTGAFIFFGLAKGLSKLLERKRPFDDELCRRLGMHFHDVRDTLTNAMQVFRSLRENKEGYSSDLAGQALLATERETRDHNFSAILSNVRVQKLVGALALSLLVAAGCSLVWRAEMVAAGHRLLHPSMSFEQAPRFEFVVLPGDAVVLKGDDLPVRVWVNGPNVQRLVMASQNPRHEYVEEFELKADSANHFSHVFEGLRDSTSFWVRVDEVRSEPHLIAVIDPPFVRKLQVSVRFPRYSRLGTIRLDENMGDVVALPGSRVTIEAHANKTLEDASIEFSDGHSQNLQVEGKKLKGKFFVKKEMQYRFRINDFFGNSNLNPIDYSIALLEDRPPAVRITVPGQDIDLTEEMKIPLQIDAQDDFGFSRLRLGYRVVRPDATGDSTFNFADLAIPEDTEEDLRVHYVWDVSTLGLFPEDALIYFAEVFDNDVIRGPNSTRSEEYQARFPSVYEIFDEVAQVQDETLEDLRDVFEQSKTLQERVETMAQKLQRDTELDWEEKKQVEQALEMQKKLTGELGELEKRVEEYVKKLDENDLVTIETLKKYQELQQLMQKIDSPELRQALEELRKALEENNPREIRQSAEELKMNQENFLKSIERTINLLKRLMAEQRLDEAIKKTRDLAERQNEINRALQEAKKEDRPKLSQEEAQLGQDMEKLEKTLQELSKQMAEMSDMPKSSIDSARATLDSAAVADNMQRMSSEINQGQMKQAQRRGKKASQSLSQTMNQLQSAQQQMRESQKNKVMQALRQSTFNLLQLSKSQENLMSQSQGLSRNSGKFQDQAEGQYDLLMGLNRVADSMYRLSQETFFVTPEIGKALGQALGNMQQSLRGLEERNGSSASRSQGKAMGSLNTAVREMRGAMQNLSGASSAMGFEEYMRKLSGMSQQQQSINQQTMELGSGAGPSQEQRAGMGRLAAQQDALRKSLEELQKEMGNRSEIMGRMGELGKEMKEVTRDLQNRNVTRRTLERQRQILSRMLDAQRSVRERDLSRKRKAEAGKIYRPPSPPELGQPPGSDEKTLRDDLMKALKDGFARDYKRLIEDYFYTLSKIEESEAENE